MAKRLYQGGIEMYAVVDSASLDLLLNHFQVALSSQSLATFLGTEVHPWLTHRAQQRFHAEGDDASGKWADLKPFTQFMRAQAGFPPDHPINHQTGQLEAYITGGGIPDARPLAFGARMDFPGRSAPGAGDPLINKKMRTAQLGNKKPPTVARPVLAMDENDLEYVLTQLSIFVTA